MKQFWITVGGVFVGLLVFFVIVPMLLIMSAAASLKSGASTAAPARAVVELDLREGLSDQPPTSPFAALSGGGLSVVRIVETLDRAEDDGRVKALFVRLPEGGMSPAAADELRQAFRRFRAAGKPVVIHSQGLQPLGAVVSTYMLGASGDELWMQSNASFQAVGLSTEDIFLGRAFERYGVRPEFEQRYEYKNAVNGYTQSDYTAAHREATLSWMNGVYSTAITTAAGDRRQTPQALRAAIEGGPWTATEARQRGLIDRLGEVEDARRAALGRAGRGAKVTSFGDYVASLSSQTGSGAAIAYIGGEGAIETGEGEASPFAAGGSSIRSDTIADAFHEAIRDKDVKAIVFRVSSPGGSDVASEQILAAVRAARAAGKPVVVSMGAYAASGGYWVSSEASAIVAQPTTLTGSIGVFGGKFVLAEALGRFGVDVRGLTVGGEYADAFGTGERWTPQQRARYATLMDDIYNGFIHRVATGRRLPEARVREIARGRVWTGAQARELGLVDELGGLHEAIQRAKALARLPADRDVRIKRFPATRSPFEALSRAFGVSSDAAEALIAVGTLVRNPEAQALIRQAEVERRRSQGAAVLADQPAF